MDSTEFSVTGLRLFYSLPSSLFLLNGKSEGYFDCKKGVRQGDPLSPLLFCLAEDVLSRGITSLVDSGVVKVVAGPKNLNCPSHVMYADDMLILCKGDIRSLEALMKIFHEYGEASVQYLNPNICKYFTGNISSTKSARISSILGFSVGSFPFNYLGVHIFRGKPRKTTFSL